MMNATKGYYSLIQYCPDESRLEAVNIGVVLFCPERGFLESRTAESNDRVRRFFGRDTFDPQRLNDAKRALVNRLDVDGGSFRQPGDLACFAQNRANGVLLTPPRPMKVVDPATQLNDLFVSLVNVDQNGATRPRTKLGRRIKALFDRSRLREVMMHDQEVHVPVTNAVLRAEYAFQNGKLNLIYPLPINNRTMTRGYELALEGDLLHRHENEMDRPAALWVAMAQPLDEQGARDRDLLQNLLHDYRIPVYHEDDLQKLEDDVEAALR